jgi:beta-glucanase (GH16 family)
MEKYPPIPPLVEVFWEDHFSIDDDWYDVGTPHTICILSAVGYLVAEDDDYYYIACTYELDSQKYSAGTAVLKNCVINFRKYTEADAIIDEVRKPKKTKGKPLNVKSSGSRKVNKTTTKKPGPRR